MSRDQLQLKEMESQIGMAAPEVDVDAEHQPDVSRRASNAGLRREAVQMRGGDATQDAEAVHAAAQRGTQDGGARLPHLEQIQRAFGRHDVSGIQAHVGGSAAEGARAIGAEAYATGDHVAFAQSPDLHTAAHEAAHVVQQSQGVNLYGGVGQAGDAHERNADAVADRVVRGESAEELLGPVTQNRAAPAQAVQRKEAVDPAQQKKDDHEHAQGSSYDALRSTMLLTGAKLRAAGKAIEDARGKNYGDAGIEPAFEIFQREFDHATDAAKHLSAVMKKFDNNMLVTDQTRIQYLGEEFRAVWGGYRAFKDAMDRANNFASSNKHAQNLNPEWVRLELASLNDRFGGAHKGAYDQSNYRSGEGGDVKSLANTALTDHLEAALHAAKEIESGTDSGIGRMRTHLNEAKEVAKDVDKSKLKSHKGDVKAILAELKQLKKDKPVFVRTWDEFEPIIHDLEKLLK